MPNQKNGKPRCGKGISKRTKNIVTFEYDLFIACYDRWRRGEINSAKMAKELGVSAMVMSNKLNYILKNNGNIPSFWFTKNGRNLEDIFVEEKIAELLEQQKEEAKNNGND